MGAQNSLQTKKSVENAKDVKCITVFKVFTKNRKKSGVKNQICLSKYAAAKILQ